MIVATVLALTSRLVPMLFKFLQKKLLFSNWVNMVTFVSCILEPKLS